MGNASYIPNNKNLYNITSEEVSKLTDGQKKFLELYYRDSATLQFLVGQGTSFKGHMNLTAVQHHSLMGKSLKKMYCELPKKHLLKERLTNHITFWSNCHLKLKLWSYLPFT